MKWKMASKQTVIASPKLTEFVFTEKLGSGTYATVYKAYRKGGLREVVAIKCVLKSSLTKSSTENLLSEIELLKKLNHENIVKLKDFQWDDHYIYLITEYCKGGDLSHFIKSEKSLPEIIVRRFLQQIASAIMYLNENNVAHMDLKPQNILLSSSKNPVVKLADFGFAKYLMDGTEMNALRGSPLYMAPEIVCKGTYDARVDLWSIGVILYECLFGRAPFASKSFKELGEKIWDSKPVELPFGVQICDDCRDLLLRLLKRNPDERILFDEFFAHPFVDLEHKPSSSSFDNALKLINEAIDKDKKGDFPSAVRLYCEALDYFMAAIHYETNRQNKDLLREKVHTYLTRVEELKSQLRPNNLADDFQRSDSMLERREQLVDLCKDNVELEAAMKIISAAENEVESEDYEGALKHYELALGALIKLVKNEPKGKRQELLRKEVGKRMSEAEKIKNYLSVKTLKTLDTSRHEEEESAKPYMGQCAIQ